MNRRRRRKRRDVRAGLDGATGGRIKGAEEKECKTGKLEGNEED